MGQLAVTGLVLAFGAAILYAAGMLLQKMVLRDLDPLTTTWLGALAGTVALLPFAPAAAAGIGEISAATVWAAVYMGIGPSALGFWFWGYAMTRFPTGRVASASLAVPAVVILMSLVTLGRCPASGHDRRCDLPLRSGVGSAAPPAPRRMTQRLLLQDASLFNASANVSGRLQNANRSRWLSSSPRSCCVAGSVSEDTGIAATPAS